MYILVGMLVSFINMFVSILPSAAWVERTRSVAIVLGILGACGLFYIALYEITRRAENGEKLGCLSIFLLPFGLWFGFILGIAPVYLGPPMARAVLFGSPTQLPFTVENHGVNDSKCPNPLQFSGMPFLIGRVCGLSQEGQAAFSPGDDVIVSGRGSPWGVFPHAVTEAD